MAFFEAMLLQFSFTPVRFLLIEVWNSLNERVKEFVETSYSWKNILIFWYFIMKLMFLVYEWSK